MLEGSGVTHFVVTGVVSPGIFMIYGDDRAPKPVSSAAFMIYTSLRRRGRTVALQSPGR